MHAADLKVVSIASCQQRMATNNRIHLIKVAAPSGCFPNQTCKTSGRIKIEGSQTNSYSKSRFSLLKIEDYKNVVYLLKKPSCSEVEKQQLYHSLKSVTHFSLDKRLHVKH